MSLFKKTANSLVLIHCRQIVENISIYCSDEFLWLQSIQKLCTWKYLNESKFLETYEAALVDCPKGYLLSDSFHNIDIQNIPFINTIFRCQRFVLISE
jgi:hypothetical protein